MRDKLYKIKEIKWTERPELGRYDSNFMGVQIHKPDTCLPEHMNFVSIKGFYVHGLNIQHAVLANLEDAKEYAEDGCFNFIRSYLREVEDWKTLLKYQKQYEVRGDIKSSNNQQVFNSIAKKLETKEKVVLTGGSEKELIDLLFYNGYRIKGIFSADQNNKLIPIELEVSK